MKSLVSIQLRLQIKIIDCLCVFILYLNALCLIIRNSPCAALYSLNIENCSVTSRTILKVAESLDSGSVLTHLSIGSFYLKKSDDLFATL